MKRAYRTIRKQGKINEQELTSFLVKNGQALLPMVDLIAQCRVPATINRISNNARKKRPRNVVSRVGKPAAGWSNELIPGSIAIANCWPASRRRRPATSLCFP